MTHDIELVGYRPGALRRNKRVMCTVTVLPEAAQAATDPVTIQDRWSGPWKQVGTSKHLRRCGLWGNRGYVEALVSTPRHLVSCDNTDIYSRLPLF